MIEEWEEITSEEFQKNPLNFKYKEVLEGGNPDMKEIFEWSKSHGVAPNVTVNGEGITDEWARWLADTCGAVAVSLYDKDKTYNTIDKLYKAGMKQVNIHYMIANETIPRLVGLIDEIALKKDPRLKGLNTLVLLSLKSKGRGVHFTSISQGQFDVICDLMIAHKLNIGFDSCSADKVKKWAKARGLFKQFKNMIEPCESTIYSSYINERGEFFPCSFMESEPGWEKGIDVASAENLLKDVWYAKNTSIFRDKVIKCRKSCSDCTHYSI